MNAKYKNVTVLASRSEVKTNFSIEPNFYDKRLGLAANDALKSAIDGLIQAVK